jgi:hypothetical protein
MKNRTLLAALAGALTSTIALVLEVRNQTDVEEIQDDVDGLRMQAAEVVAPDEA